MKLKRGLRAPADITIDFGQYFHHWNNGHLLLFDAPNEDVRRVYNDAIGFLIEELGESTDIKEAMTQVLAGLTAIESFLEHLDASAGVPWYLELDSLFINDGNGQSYKLDETLSIILIDNELDAEPVIFTGREFYLQVFEEGRNR